MTQQSALSTQASQDLIKERLGLIFILLTKFISFVFLVNLVLLSSLI